MSEQAKHIIEDTFKLLVKTYSPQPVVLERGEGCYAFDTDGKRYLDFAAGIAVASLGHVNPVILKAMQDQASKIMMCQASYATLPKLECAKLLVDHSCFDLVYFSNSGTESVEAALKCARKWAYEEKGPECNEIITFRKSFHGRTYGAASVTEKRLSQPYFGPYIDGVHFAEFNNLQSVRDLISDKTAAIILEPVQGEGGLAIASDEFLRGVRELCTANNICLIFDEVQAGMGRLGTFFAYQSFNVEPDIACLAKGMGGGFPVGAMVARERFGKAITVGTHGTTYGGNPLATAVAAAVIKELLKDGFLENVRTVAAHFHEGLKALQRRSNQIEAIKGMGMMVGLDTTIEIKTLLSGLQKNGLMATQAGDRTLRLTPPLVLTKAQADEAVAIIEKTLQEA